MNVSNTDVEKLGVRTESDTTVYEVTLVRKPMICPYCRGSMVGYGHKKRTINHPVLAENKGRIIFNANHYRCKVCGKTTIEDNPFTYEGFNSSYVLLRRAMKMLANLDYTLLMISEELKIFQGLKYASILTPMLQFLKDRFPSLLVSMNYTAQPLQRAETPTYAYS